MKVTITEAQFQRLLEFDRESDQEHKNYYRQTGFYGKIGSGCIILAKDTGRILLPKRSAEVTEPHTWGTWGGAVDIGEDTKYSAMREVYEEAGFSGDVKLYPLCVYVKEDVFKYYSYLAVVEHEFTPQLNWETEIADWFDVNNLPSPLHFGVKYIFSNSGAVNVIKRFIPIDEETRKSILKNVLSEADTVLNELLVSGANKDSMYSGNFAIYGGTLYDLGDADGERFKNQVIKLVNKIKTDGVYNYPGPYEDAVEDYFDNFIDMPQVITGYFMHDNNEISAFFYQKEFLDVRLSDEIKKLAKNFDKIKYYTFEAEDETYTREEILNSSDKIYNKAVKLPKYVYHGTSGDNALGIIKKGLRADLMKTNFKVRHNKYVFLTSIFANAEWYSENSTAANDFRAILKIDASKIDPNKINFDYDFYHDFIGKGNQYYNNIRPTWGEEHYSLRNKSHINPGAKFAKFGYDGVIFPEAIVSIFIKVGKFDWNEIDKNELIKIKPQSEQKNENTGLTEASLADIDTSNLLTKTVNHYFKEEHDEIELFLERFRSTYEDTFDDTDEEILNSVEFKQFVYQDLHNNLSDAINEIENKIENGKLVLFRQMEVTQEWLENLLYTGKHLGIYWTYDKETADAYWGKNKPFTIIISIEIDENYIDWDETLALNMNPTYSTEKEIRLFKNTPIKINSIERVKGSYYLPIDFLDMDEIRNKTFLA